jgi:hypothetical protein
VVAQRWSYEEDVWINHLEELREGRKPKIVTRVTKPHFWY